jgi:osmotically-inducible protein OsmY
MLTRTNIMRQLQKELKREIYDPSSDAQILEHLKAELIKQDWYPQDSITLSVHDGIVTFEGSILDDRIRAALRVAAENIDGVKSVEDRLLWLSAIAAAAGDAPFSG